MSPNLIAFQFLFSEVVFAYTDVFFSFIPLGFAHSLSAILSIILTWYSSDMTSWLFKHYSFRALSIHFINCSAKSPVRMTRITIAMINSIRLKSLFFFRFFHPHTCPYFPSIAIMHENCRKNKYTEVKAYLAACIQRDTCSQKGSLDN